MHASNTEFFAILDELDVSIMQVKMLEALGSADVELSVKELSERLSCSLPSSSRTIETLLQRGWLARREDEHDRRVKRVLVTDAGREVIGRVNNVRLQNIERFVATLDDRRRARLADALGDLPAPASTD
ncbi:MAG TPA: MarR family transcriptional regulator [Solirubrobacteraceae bacterium]